MYTRILNPALAAKLYLSEGPFVTEGMNIVIAEIPVVGVLVFNLIMNVYPLSILAV
jgi:hypothetical protein